MNIKPWSKMPVAWITDGRIQHFSWRADGSAGIAALQLFFVLCHFVSERLVRSTKLPHGLAGPNAPQGAIQPNYAFVASALQSLGAAIQVPTDALLHEMVAHLTYDDFAALTGLSRKSIAAGLALLEERRMIRRCGSTRSGEYHVEDLEPSKRWAKLPGQVLLSPAKTTFTALTRFGLRSKHELNALKLHLYYAEIRHRSQAYSEATYETIHKMTGVSERDIPRANSFLLTVGLLARCVHPTAEGENGIIYSANRYYLEGYTGFFPRTSPPATTSTSAT